MRGALFAIVMLTVACGNDAQSTTSPSTSTPTTATETFSGLLGLQGSSSYSFTVVGSGTASITLASLMPNSSGAAVSVVMGLGLGTSAGTDCPLTTSLNTAPALTAQLTSAVTPGSYCAEIHDVGNMTVPLNFTIRIVHP